MTIFVGGVALPKDTMGNALELDEVKRARRGQPNLLHYGVSGRHTTPGRILRCDDNSDCNDDGSVDGNDDGDDGGDDGGGGGNLHRVRRASRGQL